MELPDGRPGEFDGTRASMEWEKVKGTWLIRSVFVERPRAGAGE